MNKYTESDIERGKEILRINRLGRFECPNCEEPLVHFSGLENIPEFYYCPLCMDWAYNENGEKIARLE